MPHQVTTIVSPESAASTPAAPDRTIHDIAQDVMRFVRSQPPRILVIGDCGWDRYERLTTVRPASAHDPVPVVRGDDDATEHPAMAWAVRHAVRAAGGRVAIDDIACGLHTLTRVLIDGKPVCRRDIVHRQPKPARIIEHAREVFRDGEIDAVILADYGRGAVTEDVAREVIRLASCRLESEGGEVPVIVDPHRNMAWSKYGGATCIKASAEFAGQLTAWKWAAGVVVRTEGGHGTTIFRWSETPRRKRIAARPVRWSLPHGSHPGLIDPIGAGDVFTAWLAVGVSAGLNWFEAATAANWAAGMSVERMGTATPPTLEQVAVDASDWVSRGCGR